MPETTVVLVLGLVDGLSASADIDNRSMDGRVGFEGLAVGFLSVLLCRFLFWESNHGAGGFVVRGFLHTLG